MAEHQLAHRHERKAQGPFRRCPRADRRRATAADRRQGSATSAGGRGLACRRTQDVGREEILSRQLAGKDRPAHLGGHHQGAMGLRAGSPASERRTRSRSLRGTILARPSPSYTYDDDRLRLPPASPPRSSKAEKKESTGLRLSQLCPPCATPSSNSSLDHRRSDARIVENGFAASSGVSKSAKVVLALLWQILRGLGFPNQFFCDSWVVGFWRGRPWLAGRRIGRKSLDAFSSRFWIGWVTRRGDKCVRSTYRG